MESKLNKGIANLIVGVALQLLTLAMAIVVPRIILTHYGSETNGLLSTVTQIYSYVALLEAGLGVATVQALYKPIAANDKKEVSAVLVTSHHYYQRLSMYYLLCVIALSILGPFFLKSSLSYLSVALVIFLYGLAGVVNFYFLNAFKQLLIAEGKSYTINLVTFAVTTLTNVVKIILAITAQSVVALQASYFLIMLLQVIIFKFIEKKYYKWIDYKQKENKNALKEKNSFLVHQITNTIFNSTDTILLSTMCGLAVSSVYAVYNLVFYGLNTLINAVMNGLQFTLGLTYHEDKEKYKKLHDAFEGYYVSMVFILMTVCYYLITPFIILYTDGVTDIQYVDDKLPILFCLVQLLSCTRIVSSNLINIAEKAKETIWRAILETIINLIVSIVLVRYIGIYGVLIGTIVALLYRLNDMIIYANVKILHRLPKRAYLTVITNFITFVVLAVLKKYFVIGIDTYMKFALCGMILTLFSSAIYLLVCLTTNPACRDYAKLVKNRVLSTHRGHNIPGSDHMKCQ